jgi:RNA polymerase sigma factor (sigma-70 family)
MLRSPKIAFDKERYEEIFLARYGLLRAWAVQLTCYNREEAEDLVHDAFIQFTFARPDLDAIQNLDGYLYSLLRNLHLSQIRRKLRGPNHTLSIVDYDSVESGLVRAADPRQQIRLQDDLRQVCRYACARKETSKAGSVLILRFMHGYYPREIAEVMRSSRPAVEERLRVARGEAKVFLENPSGLIFLSDKRLAANAPPETVYARTADELLLDLRRTIFQSCQGECLPHAQLSELYREEQKSGIDAAALAHIVSCRHCLNNVNKSLGLPLLEERYPTDTIGTDTHKRGPDDFGGGSSGGEAQTMFRRCRRRARDVFEHRPQELCLSVNGYLFATQKIGGELCEQTLSINTTEKIEFVEVTSEQGVCLLFMCVDESPPTGVYTRTARAALSDGRVLEATVSFSNPWPTVRVVYHDPLMSAGSALHLDNETEQLELAERFTAFNAGTLGESPDGNPSTGAKALIQNQTGDATNSDGIAKAVKSGGVRAILDWVKRLWSGSGGVGLLVRPSAWATMLSLILIFALIAVRLHVPTVEAAELLRRSVVAEKKATANPARVLHRIIGLEERREKGGALLRRLRVEMWQSASLKVSLRRVYDERGLLLAGEWTDADGSSMIYHRGLPPQHLDARETELTSLLGTDDIWRLTPSAGDFSKLTGVELAGSAARIAVEERLGTYVLNYQTTSEDGTAATNAFELRRAALTLSKADLHAFEQTLVVGRGDEAREYKFTESSFAHQPLETVAPSIFRPEPELTGTPKAASVENEVTNVPLDVTASASARKGREDAMAAAVASPELEIEVTYLLNQIKANLGEQVEMARTTGGALRVEALVETQERKKEIIHALRPVLNHPAVILDVSTVDERLKRQKTQTQSDAAGVREVEVITARIPADAALRRYFSARMTGDERIDEEIKQASSRMMNHARRALLHASALESMVKRFSPAETRTMSPTARARWQSMIREHAGAHRRETALLRQDVGAFFFAGEVASSGGPWEKVGETNLALSARRLLQMSYVHDEAVRAALTISADNSTASAIKSQHFWRSLAVSEKLAAAIESCYQKEN